MSNIIDVKGQLPEHYQEYYPRLIHFLDLYYSWLYRNGGYTEQQIDALKEDPNAIVTDVQRFIDEGRLQDINAGDSVENLPAICEIATTPSAGTEAKHIARDVLLERTFDYFEGSDEEVFETADGELLDAPHRNENVLQSWFKRLGYQFVREQTQIGSLDALLLARLLKHIHNIKGTEQSIKIFFRMFFDEEVTVFLPKFSICTIDDNFIPDSLNVLRDDDMYQEFSYVIYTQQDPSVYQDLYQSLYLRLVHPAGFKPFLVQNPEA